MLWRGRSLIRRQAYQCPSIGKCGCLRFFLYSAPLNPKNKNMDTGSKNYPALNIPDSELSAFTVCIDLFIISLKNGELIRFTPDDVGRFYDWLISHSVRDIRTTDLLNDAAKNEEMS